MKYERKEKSISPININVESQPKNLERTRPSFRDYYISITKLIFFKNFF